MAIRTPQLPQINLSLSTYATPLFVDMEAFFEFSFWMSEELLDLEARFADRSVKLPAPQKSNTPALANKRLPK